MLITVLEEVELDELDVLEVLMLELVVVGVDDDDELVFVEDELDELDEVVVTATIVIAVREVVEELVLVGVPNGPLAQTVCIGMHVDC